jgi:hypothetical protein
MQFDTLRAFPYPVLRPDVDDYVDADIQVNVNFSASSEGQDIVAKVSFVLSVPEIEQLVVDGKAKYAIVFACRDTYYRKVELRDHADFEVSFENGFLRGEVSAFPYVTAVEEIDSYESDLVNQEFGSGPFKFEVGSVLAIDRPQIIYIDRDVFRPITSCFQLEKNENLQGAEWRIFERQPFRELMMEINSVGGFRLLDCLSDKEINAVVDDAVTNRLKIAAL